MQYLKKNNLKVAIVIANPLGWNSNNNYGGGEVVTCEIINKIDNIDCTVITSSNNLPLNKNIKVKLVKISRLDSILSFLEFSTKCFFYLINNKSKFDIFYASTTNISEIIPVLIAGIICHKKIITKYHLSVYKKSRKNILTSVYNNLKREGISGHSLFIKWIAITFTFYLLKNFNAIFCVSRSSLMEMEDYLPKNKLFLVQNGVDNEKLSKYKTDKKTYDICFLGRLEKYKGIYEFIDIAKKLNLKAVVIGDGTEKIEIIKKMKNACLRQQEHMTNIHFLGFLKNDRFKYLAQSRFLLSLSNSSEGFGLTIAESLAVGTKVICLKNDVLEKVYIDTEGVIFLDTRDEILEEIKQKRFTENGSRITSKRLRRFDIRTSAQTEVKYINEIFYKN